jgi:hypothetical protein
MNGKPPPWIRRSFRPADNRTISMSLSSLLGLPFSSYCSSSVDLKSTQKSTKCNKPCSGDPTKICGGPDSLIIFTTNTAPQKTLSNGWSTTFQCLKDGQFSLPSLSSLVGAISHAHAYPFSSCSLSQARTVELSRAQALPPEP